MKNVNNPVHPKMYGVEEIKTKEELRAATPMRWYFTTNYDLFKPVKSNRGQANSIEQKRLKIHTETYLQGMYSRFQPDLMSNLDGYILDGTHRYTMLKQFNDYIIFTINPSPEVNIDDLNELANILSKNNSISPVWTKSQSYYSALASGHPCALAIEEIINLGINKYGFSKQFLTPVRVHAIGYGFITKTKDLKLNRVDYCDDVLAGIYNSLEFKAVLDSMFKFMKAIYDNNQIIPFFVLRQFVTDMNKPFKNDTTQIYAMDWDNVLTVLGKYIQKNLQCVKEFKKNKKNDEVISKYLRDTINK